MKNEFSSVGEITNMVAKVSDMVEKVSSGEANPALADGVTLTLSDVDKRKIRIERENDLVTYVKCVDRLCNLNALWEIYPRHYTLEQIRDDLLGQRERIKNIILGPDR